MEWIGYSQVSKFLQNLIAQITRLGAPKMSHPRHGLLLLLWFGSVPAINKNVGVNEDLCVHKAPRGRETFLPEFSTRWVVVTDIAASQSDSFVLRSFFRGAFRRPGEKHLCLFRSHDPGPAGHFLVECDRYVFHDKNIVLHELRVKVNSQVHLPETIYKGRGKK